MKKKYFLTTKMIKKGVYNFYLNEKNITNLWMWFFSGLTLEKEWDASKIFIKRYAKKILSK